MSTAEHLTLQQLQASAIRGQETILLSQDPDSVAALRAMTWLQGVEALARFLRDPEDIPSQQMRMFLEISARYTEHEQEQP